MRSRYAAYALGLVDYVIDTTDPDGPRWEPDAAAWRASTEAFCRGTRFEGLRILGAGDDGDRGWVHFRAILSRGRQDVSFEERSTFVRRDGRWLYHDGGPVG
jgi:SEC-C motif domain protein